MRARLQGFVAGVLLTLGVVPDQLAALDLDSFLGLQDRPRTPRGYQGTSELPVRADGLTGQYRVGRPSRELAQGATSSLPGLLQRNEVRAERDSTSYKGYLELGFGQEAQAGPVALGLERFGISTRQDPLRVEDLFASARVGGEIRRPVLPKLCTFAKADLSQRFGQGRELDARTLSGRVGATHALGKNRYKLSVHAQRHYVPSSPYRNLLGVGGEWRRAMAPRTQISAFARWSARHSPEQTQRDIDRLTVGARTVHSLPGRLGPELFGSVFAGREARGQENNRAQRAAQRSFLGLKLGAELELDSVLRTRATVSTQNTTYSDERTAVGEPRNDQCYALGVEATWLVKDRLSLLADVSHAVNASNIDTKQYDRTQVKIALGYVLR